MGTHEIRVSKLSLMLVLGFLRSKLLCYILRLGLNLFLLSMDVE